MIGWIVEMENDSISNNSPLDETIDHMCKY